MMKKNFTGKTMIIASFIVGSILASCSKEADVKPSLFGSQDNQITQTASQLKIDTSAVVHFLKDHFISQVNTTTQTDSSILIFDFIFRKNFVRGENNQLSIAYGDQQFFSRGWKYLIAIDPTTGKVSLSPNREMEAGIVRGSFKTVSATFDLSSQIFNFVTRFEELNGNKSEVGETLSRR